MKRGIIIGIVLGILLIIIAGSVPADPETDTEVMKFMVNLMNNINDIKERVTNLESSFGTGSRARIKHVIREDTTCISVPGIESVGWCPDGSKTVFNIPDPDYTINSVVEPQVAKKQFSPVMIKRMHCSVNSIIFATGSETPYLKITCPNTPADGSRLIYTLSNPSN